MIEFMPEGSGNVIGIRAGGRLSKKDYEEVLIPRLEQLFKKHGKLDVLIHLEDDFAGWDLAAAWDDASFGLKHRADFEKIAVVGGPSWIEWCIKLFGFMMKGEIRVFPPDRLDDARKWIDI
jgi:SpoIIAA-like